MAKSLKFGNVVLCEHVVNGENNKKTFVNVFSGDIVVEDFPAHLGLGIFIEFLPDSAFGGRIDFEIQLGRKIFANIHGEVPATHGPIVGFAVPYMRVGMEKELTFSVYATAPGYRKTRVLSKRIMAGVKSRPTA